TTLSLLPTYFTTTSPTTSQTSTLSLHDALPIFSCGKSRQIWVAGGIGITPFIARLLALAKQPDGKDIDLFYSTNEPDEGFIERVDRKSTRLNSSHVKISYAVFCLKKKII